LFGRKSKQVTARGEARRRPSQRREGENPERENTQESYVLGFQLKQLDRETDSRVEQCPEGVLNATRAKALETAYGCAGGAKL